MGWMDGMEMGWESAEIGKWEHQDVKMDWDDNKYGAWMIHCGENHSNFNELQTSPSYPSQHHQSTRQQHAHPKKKSSPIFYLQTPISNLLSPISDLDLQSSFSISYIPRILNPKNPTPQWPKSYSPNLPPLTLICKPSIQIATPSPYLPNLTV